MTPTLHSLPFLNVTYGNTAQGFLYTLLHNLLIADRPAPPNGERLGPVGLEFCSAKNILFYFILPLFVSFVA